MLHSWLHPQLARRTSKLPGPLQECRPQSTHQGCCLLDSELSKSQYGNVAEPQKRKCPRDVGWHSQHAQHLQLQMVRPSSSHLLSCS